MDVEVFLTVLRGVTSPDEGTRHAAEQQLQEGKQQQPSRLISLILQVLLQGSPTVDDELRLQAAVLLRNTFRGSVDSEDHVWGRLSAAEQQMLQQSLLQAVAEASLAQHNAASAAALSGGSTSSSSSGAAAGGGGDSGTAVIGPDGVLVVAGGAGGGGGPSHDSTTTTTGGGGGSSSSRSTFSSITTTDTTSNTTTTTSSTTSSKSSLRLLRINLCDAVSELAVDLVPLGQWDAIGKALLSFIQSDIPEQQQSGWRILSETAPVLTTQLAAAAPLLCRLIISAMAAGQNIYTRVEAFSLLVALVEDSNKKVYKKLLPDKSGMWHFPPVQLLILDTIDAALKTCAADDDFALVDRLMAFLIQLCEADRGGGVVLLRPYLREFCSMMLALAVAGQQMPEAAEAAEATAAAAHAAATAVMASSAEWDPAAIVAVAAETAKQQQQQREQLLQQQQQQLQQRQQADGGGPAAPSPAALVPYASAAGAAAAATQEEVSSLESCRKLAVEALLCCVEQKRSLMLAVPDFIKRMLEALLLCMLDIRDSSYTKWLEEGEEDEDEQRFFDVGEEGLDRLCRAYSNDENDDTASGERSPAATVVLPALFNYVSQFLQRSGWEFRFVALMAVAQTVEYVHADEEEEEAELALLVNILLQHLNDADYRVRFAAAQAVGQLALDHAPHVQEQFASQVLPLLIQRMEDEVPRVQGHACAAFVNFAEEVEKKELLKVADDVMQKLLLRIQPGTPKTVREHAVTATAVVAGVLEEQFEPYYTPVIAVLLDIIRSCTAQDDRSLRGKAIECISIVGLSVGHARFVEDGKVAMEALLQIAGSTAPHANNSTQIGVGGEAGGGGGCGGAITTTATSSSSDSGEDGDIVREYLCEALGRMCRVMEADFIVYLPRILPSLLEVLAIKPKTIKTEDVDDTDEDMTYVLLDGQTSLSLKTSLVEEQARSLDLLCTISTVLQEPLAEEAAAACSPVAGGPAFLQTIAEAVLPLLGHVLSEEVKQKALETMAALMGAARQISTTTAAAAVAAAAADPARQQQLQHVACTCRELLRAMLMKTSEEVYRHLQDEDGDVEVMIAEAAGLNDCLSKAGGDILSDEEISQQAMAVFKALETSFERRMDIVARKNRTDEEVDEDDIMAAEQEEQQEQTLRSSLLEIVGALMATHPQQFLRSKAGGAAISFVQQFLKDDACDEDRSIALYVCDDIIQHLKEDGVALWPLLLPRVLDCLLSDDSRVLQAAAYGVQQAALLQQVFQPYVHQAAKNLLVAVNRPKRRKNKTEQAATDNAVAALGDLLHHHGALLSQEEQQVVMCAWLQNLPLKQDDTEGIRIHKQLLEAMLQNNPLVVGANNCNVPRLLQVLCSVYKTPFSDDELNQNIRKLFVQINESGQPAPLAALVQQGFTAKEQRKLRKMLERGD